MKLQVKTQWRSWLPAPSGQTICCHITISDYSWLVPTSLCQARANVGKRTNLTEGHAVNKIIRAGILIAITFIGGTAGIARGAVAHNTESIRHISVQTSRVLAIEPGQGATSDGFSWG